MDVSFLFSTCDNYSFLWKDFFKLFKKNMNWFDGDIVANVTNNPLLLKNIKTIKPTRHSDFSSRVLKALALCDSEYVFFMLDDFFVETKVSQDIFINALNTIKEDKTIGCIVLKDRLEEKDICTSKYNQYFSVVGANAPWRITTQAAIWRKSFLRKILHSGESAWDFEIMGTYRSFHYKKNKILYRSDKIKNFIQYHHGGVLIRGKVFDECIPFLERENINYLSWPLFSNKPHITFITKVKSKIYIYPFLSIYLHNLRYYGTSIRPALKWVNKKYDPKLEKDYEPYE